MPNLLANESSPYLLQHANNPVEWHPWGPDALAIARREDKPILLSIGYAACHWCHVMARESFEDPTTAAEMNARFVNIKVDREERPDLDGIYMQAVQAMTGHGGWPMTVFLTPSGEPFYGGTYFPPEDRHGMPSFRRLLASIADAWASKRDDVMRSARSLGQMYAANDAPLPAGDRVVAQTLDLAFRDLAKRFEPREGGFGGAPKFPQAMSLDFLLRYWARTGEPQARHMVEHSFRRMARGGIHDHVGGGFHRYSVDAHWLVPHFEKMLYDNALLSRLGVHLWQATGDAEVRRTAEDTLRWVLREMTDPSGGFYSSLDADSEHEEGKFYVWSLDELRALLGTDADAFIAHYGATAGGNFEGSNILFETAAEPATGPKGVHARAKATLYAARAGRVWPGRDEKMIASWNGLMLRAMAEGARVLGDPAMRAAALASGAFLARELVRDGRVYRTHTRGATRIAGFLEDHAAVALGFLALYELTFEREWLDRARALAGVCLTQFWSDDVGAFFDTARDHEALVTRPRDVADNATPSGTSLAVELLLTLAELTGDAALRERADAVLASLATAMAQYPPMFGHLLGAADLAVHGAVAVALAGAPGTAGWQALERAVSEVYVPSLVMAGGEGDAVGDLALMEGRAAVGGRATAYVCRNYTCALPVTDAAALQEQLRSAARP